MGLSALQQRDQGETWYCGKSLAGVLTNQLGPVPLGGIDGPEIAK
jgi:hypothetical protein